MTRFYETPNGDIECKHHWRWGDYVSWQYNPTTGKTNRWNGKTPCGGQLRAKICVKCSRHSSSCSRSKLDVDTGKTDDCQTCKSAWLAKAKKQEVNQ